VLFLQLFENIMEELSVDGVSLEQHENAFREGKKAIAGERGAIPFAEVLEQKG